MNGRNTTVVSARVPDWVAADLARRASSEGATMSELIGQVLRQSIQETEKQGERPRAQW